MKVKIIQEHLKDSAIGCSIQIKATEINLISDMGRIISSSNDINHIFKALVKYSKIGKRPTGRGTGVKSEN